MRLTPRTQRNPHRLFLLLLRCLLLVLALACLQPAWAASQGASPAASASSASSAEPGGIAWKVCEPPPICFRSAQEKQQWAQQHGCKFLEDVCEGTPPEKDNQGAKPEDQGFWGSLWASVKGGLVYGYEFMKGLIAGLKDQVTGLWELVSNVGEVFSGLVELGKAFYNDPGGTLDMLAELLGQEVVDTIKRATQCGAYDLGKVIGENVNPAVMLKLATKLAKYPGKLADAVKSTKHDLGCASFAAATLVLTPQGSVPIERIAVGQQVLSRHDLVYADAPQAVDKTFSRTAPGYRLLTTEFDQLRLTDEHPVWVQGRGWTPVEWVTEDDVLASAHGDTRVLGNETVREPIRVYNFSVARTPSYFVGSGGLWAHNAKCDIPLPYRASKSPSNYKIGASDGGPGAWIEKKRPDNPDFRYEKQITGAPKNIEYNVNGVDFDGFDAKRNVLLDAKNYGPDNPLVKGEPEDLVRIFRAQTLNQARRQLEATPQSTKIEWHVANELAARELDNLLKGAKITGITIIYTPNIIN